MSEKLRVCQEIAISMQADERAEYGEASILEIILAILKDAGKAQQLLAHMKYRTGLIVERRPGIFAFAHLSFQEYLAACAVLDGNNRGIDSGSLLREYQDPRWHEVIILYCGLCPASSAIKFVEGLLDCTGSEAYGEVLRDAYFSCRRKLSEHSLIYNSIVSTIARLPCNKSPSLLDLFPCEDVAFVTGTMQHGSGEIFKDQALVWLLEHPSFINVDSILPLLEEEAPDIENHLRQLILFVFGGNIFQCSKFVQDFVDPKHAVKTLSAVIFCLSTRAMIGLSGRFDPHENASFIDALASACYRKSEILTEFGREVFLKQWKPLPQHAREFQFRLSRVP